MAFGPSRESDGCARVGRGATMLDGFTVNLPLAVAPLPKGGSHE